ncbi:hypothetical protein FS749_011324 [Ceratobasidium sp. UAMH 11750]|nr:hypothetical protein FS749_011324 [Ceratobasidium sp. UAMH 11750]
MSGFSSEFLGLTPPRMVSPYLSLTAPFTRNTLSSLRQRLDSVRDTYPPEQAWPAPANNLSEEDKRERAAVLIPLCNVNDRPGLLLELRGNLRSHGGEVSFPGGRVDQGDSSHAAAAIRETEEELGIDPAQIEILGSLAPPRTSLRGLRVYPYVAFVHAQKIGAADQIPPSQPLPSLQMTSLRPSLPEVPFAFHLPLSEVVEKSRLRAHTFRDQEPYWTVDVTDKVAGVPSLTWTSIAGADEVSGSDQPGKLEVWGLTGRYLNVLMQWLEVYY